MVVAASVTASPAGGNISTTYLKYNSAYFAVQESTSPTDAGLSGPTAGGVFTPGTHLHAPAVTFAATTENKQTTSGLVITLDPDGVDGHSEAALTTSLLISGITGGTLYQHDGTTPINDGDHITNGAQGMARLRVHPDNRIAFRRHL